MKRLISTALIVLLLLTALSGCGRQMQSCFTAMKKAMQDCNTVEFELYEDVEMESGGILLNAKKQSFLLDGKGHTILDCASDSLQDAIQLQAGALEMFTLRNVTIEGGNTCGFLVSLSNAGVQIILENVTYNGPNLVANEGGAVHLKNCRTELNGVLGSASYFTFEEKNTIVRISGDEAMLQITTLDGQQCGVTVSDGAQISITDAGDGAFVHYGGAGGDFSVLPKAVFDYVGGMLTDGDALHSFIVDKDAAVTVDVNRSIKKPMVTLDGTMIVSERSRLKLIARVNEDSVPLVHVLGKDETADLTGKLVFSDPLEVLFFNYGPAIACKDGAGQMNWYVQCIRMWDAEHQPEQDALNNPFKDFSVNSTDRFTLITDIKSDGSAANLKTEDYNGKTPLNNKTFSFLDICVLHITRTNDSYDVIPEDEDAATPKKPNQAESPESSGPSTPTKPSKPQKPTKPANESKFSFFVRDTSGTPLSGAVFELAQNGISMYTAISDIDGIVLFDCIHPGTYIMFETLSPPGFPPDFTTHTVVVTKAGVTIDGAPAKGFSVTNTAQSAQPGIHTVRQTTTVITGSGIPGSEIRVDYFGVQTYEWFSTVNASGTWFITVPQGVTLIPGATIFAYQSQIGMFESQPTTTFVIS